MRRELTEQGFQLEKRQPVHKMVFWLIGTILHCFSLNKNYGAADLKQAQENAFSHDLYS